MPGGVGSYVKAELPFARNEFAVEDWTEEHRRIQALTIFPGSGLEPIRIVQIYGSSWSRNDGERMARNENLLEEVFRECNSNADLPKVILGDFNIEPEFSVAIASELLSGNWVDVGKSEAHAKGELPQ